MQRLKFGVCRGLFLFNLMGENARLCVICALLPQNCPARRSAGWRRSRGHAPGCGGAAGASRCLAAIGGQCAGVFAGLCRQLQRPRLADLLDTKARGWAVLGKYFAVACLSFVVNELLYWWLLNSLHWNYLISLFLVLVVVAVATFVLSKFWAFSNKKRQ